MAYKAPKPTKAQLAEGRARASASGIAMNQSAKGLRNASKVIIAGASMLPAGRAVKAVSTASKMAKTADARRKFNAATERRILDNQAKKNVKVISPLNASMRKIANQKSTMLAERAKSGQAAKTGASVRNQKIKADKTKAMKLEAEKQRAYFERTGKTAVPRKNPSKNGVRVIKNK